MGGMPLRRAPRRERPHRDDGRCSPIVAPAQWEVIDEDGNWTAAPTTHDAELAADRTTPFELAAPVVTPAIRVRAEAGVTIRQIEVFDLG